MTIANIIKQYLSECTVANSFVFGNHIIQTKLPDYGVTVSGKLASPDTYSRAWRAIREERDNFEWEGFIISEEKTGFKSREKHFRIRRKNVLH